MAIGLLKQAFVRRSQGGHVVGKAAYISGVRLHDEMQGRSYAAKPAGVLLEGLLTPSDAPEWANSRQALWNAVEARERRKDSTLARDLVIALPHELDLESNQRLLEGFLRQVYVSRGYSVDFAIHEAHRGQQGAHRGDARNIHAHVLVPLRAFERGEWSGAKDNDIRRQKHGEEPYVALKEAWDRAVNAALAEAGLDQRVTCRSYEERGERFRGQVSEGKEATHLQRRTGVDTALRTLNKTIGRYNDLVAQHQEWGDRAPELAVGLEAYGELIEVQQQAFKAGQSGKDLAALQQEVGELAGFIEDQMASARQAREAQELRLQEEQERQRRAEEQQRQRAQERERQLQEQQHRWDQLQAQSGRRQRRRQEGVEGTLARITQEIAAVWPRRRWGFALSGGEQDASGQPQYTLAFNQVLGEDQFTLMDNHRGKDLLQRGFLWGRDEGAIDLALEVLEVSLEAQVQQEQQRRAEERQRAEQERQRREEEHRQRVEEHRRQQEELARQRREEQQRRAELGRQRREAQRRWAELQGLGEARTPQEAFVGELLAQVAALESRALLYEEPDIRGPFELAYREDHPEGPRYELCWEGLKLLSAVVEAGEMRSVPEFAVPEESQQPLQEQARQLWQEHVFELTRAVVRRAFDLAKGEHIYLDSQDGRTHAEYDRESGHLTVRREGTDEVLLDAQWDGERWTVNDIQAGQLDRFAQTLHQRVVDRQRRQQEQQRKQSRRQGPTLG